MKPLLHGVTVLFILATLMNYLLFMTGYGWENGVSAIASAALVGFCLFEWTRRRVTP